MLSLTTSLTVPKTVQTVPNKGASEVPGLVTASQSATSLDDTLEKDRAQLPRDVVSGAEVGS